MPQHGEEGVCVLYTDTECIQTQDSDQERMHAYRCSMYTDTGQCIQTQNSIYVYRHRTYTDMEHMYTDTGQ